MKTPQQKADAITDAISAVVDAHNTDIFFYAGAIYEPSDAKLVKLTASRKLRPNLLLILYTSGGDPNAAYRIARRIQSKYQDGKFTILVHSECKSAGTLIALAADEIVMCDLAELGPLDVQVKKTDELFERSSGLTPIQAMVSLRGEAFGQFEHYMLTLRKRSGLQVSTKFASEMAARMVIGLLRPIYQQIDPMRLGETQRAMLIAQQYGERLGQKNLKEGALYRLVAEYPSHDFIIDREEACELFKNVREPTEAEARLSHALAPLMADASAEVPIAQFISKPPANQADKKGKTHGKANGKPKGKNDQKHAAKTATETDSTGRNSSKADGKGDAKPVGSVVKNGALSRKTSGIIARIGNLTQ